MVNDLINHVCVIKRLGTKTRGELPWLVMHIDMLGGDIS